MGKLKEKLKGEVEKVYGTSAYDGLTVEQIKERMAFGGEDLEEGNWMPLEEWMRRHGLTREEVLAKWPQKFSEDGSFKR